MIPISNVFKKKITFPVVGISAASFLKGEEVEIISKGKYYSNDPQFEMLEQLIISLTGINMLSNINDLLVILPPPFEESIFYLNPNILPTGITIRDIKKGEVVFERDIVDYISLSVQYGNTEIDIPDGSKVLFLVRSGFNFGFMFDFCGKTNSQIIQNEMLSLFKSVRFINTYSYAMNALQSKQFNADGWFPFFEILHSERQNIASAYEEDNERKDQFMNGIVDRIISRADEISLKWWKKQFYQSRQHLFTEAIDNMKVGKVASAIKIFITEFEGILMQAWLSQGNSKESPKIVMEEIFKSNSYAGPTESSLIFPHSFINYVKKSIYAKFDFSASNIPNSRHAIAHGAAKESQYTKTFACQTFLSLDNLWYFV